MVREGRGGGCHYHLIIRSLVYNIFCLLPKLDAPRKVSSKNCIASNGVVYSLSIEYQLPLVGLLFIEHPVCCIRLMSNKQTKTTLASQQLSFTPLSSCKMYSYCFIIKRGQVMYPFPFSFIGKIPQKV